MDRNFMLAGFPLGHSISPQIHKRLFEYSGVNGEYALMEIPPRDFAGSIVQLRKLDGFNVTIPYKRSIMPFLQSVDARAKAIGAVNTVKCAAGAMHGYNTDVTGFHRALENAGIGLAGRVLVCGTGGASRMLVFEALTAGCSVCIAARDEGKAAACAAEFKTKFPNARINTSVLNRLSAGFDLILNGTPAGMFPDTEGCPVPYECIVRSGAVFDAVYNPANTMLLKHARAAGVKSTGGLAMLVWQAAAAQEIWFGTRFIPEQVNGLCSEMARVIGTRYSRP